MYLFTISIHCISRLLYFSFFFFLPVLFFFSVQFTILIHFNFLFLWLSLWLSLFLFLIVFSVLVYCSDSHSFFCFFLSFFFHYFSFFSILYLFTTLIQFTFLFTLHSYFFSLSFLSFSCLTVATTNLHQIPSKQKLIHVNVESVSSLISRKNTFSTILIIIFWNFATFWYRSDSPQVKRKLISIIINLLCKLLSK